MSITRLFNTMIWSLDMPGNWHATSKPDVRFLELIEEILPLVIVMLIIIAALVVVLVIVARNHKNRINAQSNIDMQGNFGMQNQQNNMGTQPMQNSTYDMNRFTGGFNSQDTTEQ